jgi:hypothetical protein
MVFREIFFVEYENYPKQINKTYDQTAWLVNVAAGGRSICQ